MTDPNGPATELGTIYVVGQRRAPGGSFPQRGGGGGGGGSGEDGIHQNQVSQDEPPPPYVQDPCADPSLAREWNTDAAAAEAKAKFLAKAAELGDEELYQREFHAFLYRDSNGRVQVGGVTAGNRVGSTNHLQWAQTGPASLRTTSSARFTITQAGALRRVVTGNGLTE